MLFEKEIRKLGFGLMRLPKKDNVIDIEQVKEMTDRFMEAGFTYFDTAWAYEGSEEAVRQAMVERYPRESFQLATKNAAWIQCKTREDAIAQFETSLAKTGAGYFDCYLLHNLGEHRTRVFDDFKLWDFVKEKKAEGKIRHFGFSFHGSPAYLIQVLDKHPEVEFVQIQLNYADWKNPVVRSGELYEILHGRNIPMIIMEPVKGGTLASLTPELEAMYKAIRPEASVASWALRFVGSLPGVMTILSGMSTRDQMEDNLSTFRNFEPLSAEEKKTVEKVKTIMLNVPQIGCTSCRYCTPGCPMNISIPDVFRALNTMTLYGDVFRPKAFYGGVIGLGHGRASECIGCGQCEGVCPQHLPIISLLKEASSKLDT